MTRPVSAMHAAGHNSSWYRQHRARTCKKTQGRGTLSFETGKEIKSSKGGPPAQGLRSHRGAILY